jgi:hypothetical protein
MKEYQDKNQKPTVVEEPIKQSEPEIKLPDVKLPEVTTKKEKTVKKVIRYVETDSDDDDEEEVVKKKPLPIQPIQQVEKSYNELICESSLERMQSKIMNERAKHVITHIIPTYY